MDLETEAALSLLQAGQGRKRNNGGDDSPDAAGGFNKRIRLSIENTNPLPALEVNEAPYNEPLPPLMETDIQSNSLPAINPFPYFFYRNFSLESDPDPLSPLTPPGRVPNFPAKMHAILSRSDLSEIICWMPHGRAWRVLKPREFEVKVIPIYFEHAKFSSFIRQANGWGFRRVTQGRDRNAYYHELFLRGMPFLCKQMKRPAVAEKLASDPDHEPDFYRISQEHPLPEKEEDQAILLQCTIEGGPKARMPIYTSSFPSSISIALPESKPSAASVPQLTPRDQDALSGFQTALRTSEHQLKALSFTSTAAASVQSPSNININSYCPTGSIPPAVASSFPVLSAGAYLPSLNTLPYSLQRSSDTRTSPLITANRLAFPAAAPSPNITPALPNMAAAQFAAGFAAATALSQHQLRNVLNNFAFIPRAPPSQEQKYPPGSSHS